MAADRGRYGAVRAEPDLRSFGILAVTPPRMSSRLSERRSDSSSATLRLSQLKRRRDGIWWNQADAILERVRKRPRPKIQLPRAKSCARKRVSTGSSRRCNAVQKLVSSVRAALLKGAEATVIAPEPVRRQLVCDEDQAVEVIQRVRRRLSLAGVETLSLNGGRWHCALPSFGMVRAATAGSGKGLVGGRPESAKPAASVRAKPAAAEVAMVGCDARARVAADTEAEHAVKRRRRWRRGVLSASGDIKQIYYVCKEVGAAGRHPWDVSALRRPSLVGHWQLPGWSARLLLFTGEAAVVARCLAAASRRVLMALLRDAQQATADFQRARVWRTVKFLAGTAKSVELDQ